MMNYNEFAAAVQEQIKDYLPSEFKDAEIQTVKVKKNNDVEKEGISIKYSKKVSAVFYPEDLYILYQKGVAFENIMKKIANGFLDSMISEDQVQDIAFHYDAMKDKLFVSVCNAGKNAEMLQGVPHEIREDLALIYKAYLTLDEAGSGTMIVNNEIMKIWGVSETELREQAWKNMHKILPHTLTSVGSVIKKYVLDSDLDEELRNELIKGTEETELYVLTNEAKIYGAAYMFDNELLDQISQKLGGNLMVIPSSVHEVLLKKIDKDITFDVMKGIVQDVNKQKIIPEEILSDELYVFDSVEKKLSIAKVQDLKQDLDMWPEEVSESEQEQEANDLMTFQEFKETVLNEIRSFLPKDFDGKISIEAVKKYDLPLNDALIIRQNGSKYAPHIDLGAYYDFHKARVGMEDILRNIASAYRTETAQAQEYVQRAGMEEYAVLSNEMTESPENEGQNLGMEQSM